MPASTRVRESSRPRRSIVTLAAQGRQKSRACLESPELGQVGNLAPVLVVDVLLAAAVVAAGGLQMAVGVAANPDVGPGRRNRERVDARELAFVAKAAAVAVEVVEAFAVQLANEARLLVDDVTESREAG